MRDSSRLTSFSLSLSHILAFRNKLHYSILIFSPFQGLLKTAEHLKIKGLCEIPDQATLTEAVQAKRNRVKRSRSPENHQYSRESVQKKSQELPSIHKASLNNGSNSLVILEHRVVPRNTESKERAMASLGMGMVS